jgi:hypothetical protein
MPKALRDMGDNLIGLLMDLPIIGAFAVHGSPPLTGRGCNCVIVGGRRTSHVDTSDTHRDLKTDDCGASVEGHHKDTTVSKSGRT